MDQRRAAAALLALAACISCSAAAPTAGNHTALELHSGPVEGCYYNFQHYGEGDRIMTNEPCLNCTCHNRMLMCYLRVCPFTKAIGQDCTVEKRADQCCPIVTCPDVPVDLLTSTSTSSPAEYGATGLGKLDKYGCSIHGKYFPEGSKVPPSPNKPCEHCYCIRNMTTCVMQECTLHVDGCTPIYHKDVCCPVRYSCDHPEDEIPLLDDMTTTVRPTPGFLLTTTTSSPVTQMSQDCVHDDQVFADGALIKTEKACEHCYCMKGDIVCVVQECGTPMENEGKNCTSLPPRHGQCCPDTYICEGDESVTDTTTEFVDFTSSPPRRVGVEGSGYRNEPDEPHTEISPMPTEIEGSGEEFGTDSQVDTGDNVTPQKDLTDEILFATTESDLHLIQSTEPDKGQNTIPDLVDKETTQEQQDEVTLPGFDEFKTTNSKDYTTTSYLTSRKDVISTTESVTEIKDESNVDKIVTPQEHIKETTDSSDIIDETTSSDTLLLHTNPIIVETDLKETTPPASDYTTEVQKTSDIEKLSTETMELPIVTEENKLVDVLHTSTEPVISIEQTTYTVTKLVDAESSSVNPNLNEIDDSVPPTLTPSRIPGEGDCLLNGITYANNTSVPTINNCHTDCKCKSSIIKCDPIICSPPPEYMENMNDCQPIYDTPNSCCPTYVCDVKETIPPPQSHSHMSGTETPKPITQSDCSGNDCYGTEDKKVEPNVCTSGNCDNEGLPIQKECDTNECKDQAEMNPLIPSQDCPGGQCQILPLVPCEGDHCKTETTKDTLPANDTEFTKPPSIPEECKSDDCKQETQSTPTQFSTNCSDGKCEISSETSCDGEDCKIQPSKEITNENELEPTIESTHAYDVPPKICDGEKGCDENNIPGIKECEGESCRRNEVGKLDEKLPSKCSGTDCKQQDEPTIQTTEEITEGSTVSVINLKNTESIEPQVTTPKEKLTDLESDFTKPPTYTDSAEHLPTTIKQIMTESPEKYVTEKETTQTDAPVTQTETEIDKETVTKASISESPKIPTTISSEAHETESQANEQLSTGIDSSYTKTPEYIETETKENEQSFTKSPPVYTQEHFTILEEDFTKSPHITIDDLDIKSDTNKPELHVTDKSKTESPEVTTRREEYLTIPIETIGTEKEIFESGVTGSSLTEAIQTTPEASVTEKVSKHSESTDAISDKEYKETLAPELLTTEKVLQETEGVTDRYDTQTKTPETYVSEKESIETETTIAQTEAPEIVVSIKETSSTESSEIVDSEKQTLPTIYTDGTVTTKQPLFTEVIQTTSFDATSTEKAKISTDTIGIEKEKEVIKVTTPDLHESKLEPTSTYIPLEEKVSTETISVSPGTDEAESYATKEPVTSPSEEEKKHDESYKPVPTQAEEAPNEGATEITTEHIISEVTKIEAVPEKEVQSGVTELVTQSSVSEEADETITKETHHYTTGDLYTKSPQEIETKEKEVSDKDFIFTLRPEEYETKSDNEPKVTEQSITISQEIVTKAPEELTSQHDEISTVHTDKYKDIPDTDTELTQPPTSEITDKHEKHTEAPEIYSTISQGQDKTTLLPTLYTTLADEIFIPEKITEKQYETPSSDDEHRTTLNNREEFTTESNKFITLTPEVSTEAQQQYMTDKNLESESPHLSTKTEDKPKESESSTQILEQVTETSKTHDEHEEKDEDMTTKITTHEIVTETSIGFTSASQSTYEDELSTDLHPIISTKESADSYDETSTKAIMEKEKETHAPETTTKPQISNEASETESTLKFTQSPEPDLVTENDIVKTTTKNEEQKTEYDNEKDGAKPIVSDENDTTEESYTGTEFDLEVPTTYTSIRKDDINVQESTEISHKGTESITIGVQNTSDQMSTESYASHTSLEDKLSPTITYEKEVEKEQKPAEDEFLLPSTSVQPEGHVKTTEQPMSLVTHFDDILSPQTTLSSEGDITEEQALKTTVEQKLQEEKLQTTTPEVTKQSTESPKYDITQKEVETESSSDSNNLVTDHVVDITTSIMEDNISVDRTSTEIPHVQTDFSKEVPTSETAPKLNDQNTEITPTSDRKDETIDTEPQQTTTVSSPVEIEPDLTQKQETPLTESTAEVITKSPYETQTVAVTTIFTKPVDDKLITDNINTETPQTEQHSLATDYPNTNVYDIKTTESEGLSGTEATKLSSKMEVESGTSVYVPIVTEITESPIDVTSKVSEPELTEKDHKPTEIVNESDEYTHKYSDEITEKEILDTHSKPSFTTEATTLQKEFDNEVVEKLTTISDQVVTQKISKETTEHYGITDGDKDKIDALLLGTTQIPEVSPMITESHTEVIDIDKTISNIHLLSEESPTTVNVKATESEAEQYSTQALIEKESFSTEATADFSKETDKAVTIHHMPTEFTLTTLHSATSEAQITEKYKESEISEEPKPTTESVHDFSETTPFLVELKEHTHQIIDESSSTPNEILTSPAYEQQPERGDQNLDITDKYDEEYQTTVPTAVTEHKEEDKEKPVTQDQEEIVDAVPTSAPTLNDITEILSDTKIVPTTSSTLLETDSKDIDKHYTNAVPDVILTTSVAPQTVSETELYTTKSTEIQTSPAPPETPSTASEKEITLTTKEPLKSDSPTRTTLLEDDSLPVTTKSTTSKIKEESTTQSTLVDNTIHPEEKPIKTTHSPTSTQELTKPAFDDEINEGMQPPDFPPSGTGGYGQEPDYVEEDQAFGPGTCRYGGKVYVSAQQIPRDDPCDFCFCFRSDIICLQQSCPPPIHGCHEEPIQGFCCPRYECPVSMATTLNVTTTTTTTTTTLPPHFLPHAYKGAAHRRGCQIKGHTYKVGEVVRASSGPCLHCTCGGDGQMKCDPKACTPEPMLRQMIAAAVSAKRRR